MCGLISTLLGLLTKPSQMLFVKKKNLLLGIKGLNSVLIFLFVGYYYHKKQIRYLNDRHFIQIMKESKVKLVHNIFGDMKIAKAYSW